MRRFLVVVTVIAVVAAAAPAVSAARSRGHGGGDRRQSAPREPVCHANHRGVYRLVKVGPKALDRHLGHGDARPGDAVPGMAGYVFDSKCKPTPDEPTEPMTGTIIVEKQTVPDGGSQGFTFTGDVAGTISDGETIVVSNVVAGTYTSTETVPSGWDITAITCDDTNSSGAIATATFNVEAGETVTCVFTNTVIGLDIEKTTNGNDADDPDGSNVPQIAPFSPVTWSYVVFHGGSVSVPGASVTVTDSVLGVIAGPASGDDGDGILEPGESWVYTAIGVALDLSLPTPPGVTVVLGCGFSLPTYENIGRVSVAGVELDSDPSHYCNVSDV